MERDALIGELNHADVNWIQPAEDWNSRRRGERCPQCGEYQFSRQWSQPDGGKCTNCGTVVPVSAFSYSSHYGDWGQIDSMAADPWFIPQYCGGSDYSGSLVEVSNYRVLCELCAAAGFEDGKDYITYTGGYGTFDIAIRLESILQALKDDSPVDDKPHTVVPTRASTAQDILDTIKGLRDYPLADEGLNSELEIESQNEAWDSWARSDFKRALADYIAAATGNDILREYLETEREDAFTDEQASQWFYQLADLANEYWVNECGSDSYINVDRVVKRGLGRDNFQHWPEGKVRQTDLYREIMETAQSGCTAAMLSGEF